MADINLKGQVVIISGGCGLLGKEFAAAISDNNGIPVIADIDEVQGEKLAEKINKKNPDTKSCFIKLDITSKSSIEDAIKKITKRFGQIDSIVNTAYPRNKNYGRHFFDVEYKDFCDNINLHLGGYFLTSQIFSKYFINQGHGNIINIASIYGVIAPRFDIYEGTKMTMPVEYAAIKSAVIHITKYIAAYIKDKNIRINCISPGGILDNQDRAFLEKYKKQCINKGMLDRSDLNGTLLFLLSDHSRYINGQNIIVDDGFTV